MMTLMMTQMMMMMTLMIMAQDDNDGGILNRLPFLSQTRGPCPSIRALNSKLEFSLKLQ